METKEKKSQKMPFTREKYILLLAGLLIVIIGFVLMIGGSTSNPDVFDAAIYSFRRISLAPILIILGFIIVIYAIMKKTKKKDQE
jgi:uncharacterized membrane protein